MCIIIYKSETASVPTKKTLKTCWDNNPDGAGFMIAKGGTVVAEKGFLSFADFYKAWKACAIDKNTAAALHFRIGTSGAMDGSATHPFPVSSIVADLQVEQFTAAMAIMHNGILADYSDRDKTLSDTQCFVRDVLSPLMAPRPLDKYALSVLHGVSHGSRLLVFDRGQWHTVGAGWIPDKSTGLFFSNAGYKTIKRTYKSNYSYDQKTNRYTYRSPEPETVFCPYCGEPMIAFDTDKQGMPIYYCDECNICMDSNGNDPDEANAWRD